MERTQLGLLAVDAGDVVCFSMDQCMKIAEKLGYKDPVSEIENFIEDFAGVPCNFAADGTYGVDKVAILDENGEEYEGVLIGGPTGDIKLK